jgi:hypothetical protein
VRNGERNICRQICQFNRILSSADMAGKRTLLAVNMMTPAGRVEGDSMRQSM